MEYYQYHVGYDYTKSTEVVRPKLNVICNYAEQTSSEDTEVRVVCEGGANEIEAETFIENPQVYIYFTNGEYQSNFKIKIKKLI